MKTLACICPVFREEAVIAAFHQRLRVAVSGLRDRYDVRIVYVVDPSPDRTEEILRDIVETDSGVLVLVMSRRFGHQASLMAGIDHAECDAVVMLDSDLQHPPELIPEMVSRFEAGADIVQMLRVEHSSRPPLLRWASRQFYRLINHLSDIDVKSAAADFRLLNRRAAEVLREQLREQDPFLRGLVHWMGFNVCHLEFQCEARAAGTSKYSLRRLMHLAASGIFSFSLKPLRYGIAAGLTMSVLSIVCALLLLVFYFVVGVNVPGWTTLAVATFFLSGVQLVFLGLLGEYVGVIIKEVKDRPLYLVDRRHGPDPGQPPDRDAPSAAARRRAGALT